MISAFSKFRIPTLLGLGIILAGIITGVMLVLRNQNLISFAAPDVSAQQINITNITSTSASISFQTSVDSPAFLTYGINSPAEKTILDERDSKRPQSRKIHYFTLKDLKKETNYQYKITTGKKTSDVLNFQTSKAESVQNGFSPVIGSVTSGGKVVDEGLAFILISGAVIQSALIKNGSFLIPISYIRKSDLSDTFIPSEKLTAKLTIVSNQGEANILFILKPSDNSLPTLKIGQNLDLTSTQTSPILTPTPPTNVLNKFDLNGDGFINTADNAMVLKNFGKNPQDKRADLDKDGDVDKDDLDLMAKQINQ